MHFKVNVSLLALLTGLVPRLLQFIRTLLPHNSVPYIQGQGFPYPKPKLASIFSPTLLFLLSQAWPCPLWFFSRCLWLFVLSLSLSLSLSLLLAPSLALIMKQSFQWFLYCLVLRQARSCCLALDGLEFYVQTRLALSVQESLCLSPSVLGLVVAVHHHAWLGSVSRYAPHGISPGLAG